MATFFFIFSLFFLEKLYLFYSVGADFGIWSDLVYVLSVLSPPWALGSFYFVLLHALARFR